MAPTVINHQEITILLLESFNAFHGELRSQDPIPFPCDTRQKPKDKSIVAANCLSEHRSLNCSNFFQDFISWGKICLP